MTEFVPEKHLPEMGWELHTENKKTSYWIQWGENKAIPQYGILIDGENDAVVFDRSYANEQRFSGHLSTLEFATELFKNLGIEGKT